MVICVQTAQIVVKALKRQPKKKTKKEEPISQPFLVAQSHDPSTLETRAAAC